MPVFPPPQNQPVSTPDRGDSPHQQLVGANKNVRDSLETHVQPMRRGVVAANAALNTSADPQPTFPMAPNGQCMDLVNGDGVPLFPEIPYMSAVSTDSYSDANMAAPQPSDASQQQYYQPRDPYGSGYIQNPPRQMPFVSYVHVDRGLADDDYGLYPKTIWAPDGSILSSKPAPGYADPIVQGKRVRIRWPQDHVDTYYAMPQPNAFGGLRTDGGSINNGTTLHLATAAASPPKQRAGLRKDAGDDGQGAAVDVGDIAPYGTDIDPTSEPSSIAIRSDGQYRSVVDTRIDGTTITKDPTTGELSAGGGSGSKVRTYLPANYDLTAINGSGNVLLTLGGVDWDTDSWFDSGSPDHLTAPAAGFYEFSCHFPFNVSIASSTGYQIEIYFEVWRVISAVLTRVQSYAGESFQGSPGEGSANPVIDFGMDIRLQAGDVIRVYANALTGDAGPTGYFLYGGVPPDSFIGTSGGPSIVAIHAI